MKTLSEFLDENLINVNEFILLGALCASKKKCRDKVGTTVNKAMKSVTKMKDMPYKE